MATPPSFPALDSDSVYAFEADTANLIHLRAWDDLPSASEYPWSLFSAELAAFTSSGGEGNLVAEAYRYADTTLVAGTHPWQLSLYRYDREGRLAEKQVHTGGTPDWQATLRYRYNRQGELTALGTTAGGKTLWKHYAYNQRGLLGQIWISPDSTLAGAELPEVTYTYTATGATDSVAYRGGTGMGYGYTIRDWVSRINNTGSAGTFAAGYTYQPDGAITVLLEGDGQSFLSMF